MIRTQQITLDVYEAPYFEYVNAKQRDNDSRVLVVTLTDQGKEIRPDHTTDRAVFRARKPDGTCVLDPATIGEDGKITVALSDQVLAVPGDVEADIAVVNGDDILSTASFYIQVAKAPLGQKIVSENEFLVMVEAAAKAEEAAEAANEAAGLIAGMTVSASKVAAGGTPTAELTKKDGHYELDLGLVTGDKGDKGDAATVQVGTVTTGEPGSSASVKNSGTGTDAKLDFVIPQGPIGPTGPVSSVNGGTGDVVIGGRNLVLNTSGTWQRLRLGVANYEIDGNEKRPISDLGLKPGDYVTGSIYVDNRIIADRGIGAGAVCMFLDASESAIRNEYLFVLNGKNERMVLTFIVPDNAHYLTVRYGYSTSLFTEGEAYVKGLKLEVGTIATCWTPAPEDKADVPTQFDISLPASRWANGSQTVKDARFVDGDQYEYGVDVKGACIPWDGITVTDGQMVARADIVPTTDMTWTVTRREVRKDG